MCKSPLFIRKNHLIILAAYRSIAVLLAAFGVLSGGCQRNSIPDSTIERNISPPALSPGADILIGLLDELDMIAGAGSQPGNISRSTARSGIPELMPGDARKQVIASTATDTTFVYGEITPDGFGAVVTERHQYPKGLLLITIRKKHGEPE